MVHIITRRGAIAGGAGLAASGLAGFRASAIPIVGVAPPKLPLGNGASLRVPRPTKFVDNDETIFRENIKRFSREMRVPVRVDFAGWEDLRPQWRRTRAPGRTSSSAGRMIRTSTPTS